MSPNPRRIFHYHACAQAFSANFKRPFHHQIDVQAQSALPVTGGHGHSRVENFEFANFISFKRAHSHVSGGHQVDDDSNNTLSTSSLEHLNMFDILTADRIVSRLYSKHHANQDEGEGTFLGSKFENVRIAGFPVKLEIDCSLIEKLKTFESAVAAFKENNSLALGPITIDQIKRGGSILCSIVKKIEIDCPDVKPVGDHGLYVKGFGTVFFGELLVKHSEKTLTMLRFNLGSTTEGSGSGGGSRTGGQHYP